MIEECSDLVHSLLFFSLFCSFSTSLRSCPDGLGRLVCSLASFLVLPFRAEASAEGAQVKRQQQVWTHLWAPALTRVFVGQVVILVLVVIFLLEAARLQVLRVHVAHLVSCCTDQNTILLRSAAFIPLRLLPPPRRDTPPRSAFFPESEVLESSSCFREKKNYKIHQKNPIRRVIRQGLR